MLLAAVITPPVSNNRAWLSGKSTPLQTLDTLLHAGLLAQPDKPAVIHSAGALSYTELHALADAIAVGLLKRGVKQGDRVGVLLNRDEVLIPSLLAILKIGAAYVPLDSSFPLGRLRTTLEHAQVTCLLATPELGEPLQQTAPLFDPAAFDPAASLTDVHKNRAENRTVDTESDSLANQQRPQNTDALSANLIYTSGTTGTPKGVSVSRAAIANLLLALQDVPALSSADIVLGLATIAFDIHVLELLAPLAAGATIVLAGDQAVAQPPSLLALIKQHKVTLIQATPSMWGVLLGAGLPTLPNTRGVAGGERLAPATAVALSRRLQRCWNMYGPTEATVYTTAKLLTPDSKVSIGAPLNNISIAVVEEGPANTEGQQARESKFSSVGEVGELAIMGAGLADGYWQNPTATSARFVTLTVQGQPVRAYLSGDLAFVDHDGNVHCEGRIDQQIKLRGHRIELSEIEHVLLTHPQLNEAACSVHSYAQDDNRLVAYHTNNALTAIDLRDFIRHRLPPYMVPQRFMYLPELPRLPSGKLDRQSLPRPSLSTQPLGAPTRRSVALAASADSAVLAASWQALLGGAVPTNSDNFMDQGGHSLLALRLVQEIAEQTGKELPIRLIVLDNFATLVAFLEAQEATTPNRKTGILAALKNRFGRKSSRNQSRE